MRNISKCPNIYGGHEVDFEGSYHIHEFSAKTFPAYQTSRFIHLAAGLLPCPKRGQKSIVLLPKRENHGNLEVRYAGNVFAEKSSIWYHPSKSTSCPLQMFGHFHILRILYPGPFCVYVKGFCKLVAS